MKQAILAIGLLTSMSSFAAEQVQNNVTYSLTAGYVFGGETILDVTYTNDDTKSIKSGQGIVLGAGLSYELNEEWAIDVSANYHADTARSKQGDISFERFAFNAISYYNINESFSAGLGLGLHTAVELNNDLGADVSFDNEIAYIASVKYHFETLSADLELRHTRAEYDLDRIGRADFSGSNITFDGNNTGVLFHWKF
ncbi:outer membrane beta-barrel protein [Pseudoalteromonas luteoviolacea]|uniref:Outer membrane protein beta-barrel domain-containing protein n=1 Tax=Pseudoalteromonas luteoviolacea S4054 TaxID=1129367 RepID=A0A0F6A8I6_9GAMM|nr:outer membrane beta-barrel protein [Pseudoalteromonas luteoviolacea]AOT06549.1 hypothetical protein S4054249_01000 [Pseudoalteromonas luteoviolacea]AOT11466.1 hypothetical protein S40542_01000 [Pseudoalteromonas luteoviolacea]AOT16379.1 hypothetical protein S4054_01000 [Pseudoalteromonas luteoviolacea]KKE81714.1 hypothetical protein N479_21665 [Pseudoalteromonas luteoviolacea S4054]KZN71213.1 hypothetical protein N481_19620 [Pseudoalteromonas luteoviolacea S4047-1]